MEWLEVKIHTHSEGVEALCALLMELGAGAVQIEDSVQMKQYLASDEKNWDYVDEELLNIEEDFLYVQLYLTHDEHGHALLNRIKYGVSELGKFDFGINMGSLLLEYKVRSDEEWVDNWKKYYKPLEIGRNIVVKPEWEQYSPPEGAESKVVFAINPGHLFGTGLHQSTQLCLENLESIISHESNVLDIGCGSGILSLVSLMLGANSAFALDLEPGCEKVVTENALLNNIDMDKLTIRAGNALIDEELVAEISEKKYNVIVANIVADIIIALLPLVKKILSHDGMFVTSGIIDERCQDVCDALLNSGFVVEKITDKDNWVSIVARLG